MLGETDENWRYKALGEAAIAQLAEEEITARSYSWPSRFAVADGRA
jgi:hypothetical protein